jgi:hypothetical protein
MIEIVIAFGIGFAFGCIVNRNQSEEQEQPKDLSYYKNLSESLLQDVRRLREELRNKND